MLIIRLIASEFLGYHEVAAQRIEAEVAANRSATQGVSNGEQLEKPL